MRNSFKRFFLRNPSNYIFWISLALLVKGLIPFLRLFFGMRSNPHLLSFEFIGDTPSYTDPIESLLAFGHYNPDHRMPGYGIIYLIFRLFFSYNSTYNIIVISQLIISSLSVYCLALIPRLILKSDKIFYLTFYMFLISNYSNYYDICLMTESLSSAFLIFGTWYFALYFQKQKLKFLFFAGLFFAWNAFLRPVFVAVLFIYGILLLFYSIKNNTKFIKPLFIYGLVFILADGAWITRNYKVHDKFIPLSNGIPYPYVEYSYMSHTLEFVQSWGGAIDLPDPRSAISWFGGILFPAEPEVKQYDSIPGYIYTSKFNKDSLYALRKEVKKFMALQKPAVDSLYSNTDSDWFKSFAILYKPLKPVSQQAAALQNDIDNKFDRYKNSIKNEKPFLYYVEARIVLLRKFLFENNETFLRRGQIPGTGNLLVLFYHCYYLFLVFFGIAGIILLAWQAIRHDLMFFLLCTIPAYTIFIHPFIRLADNRYLIPAWPFLIVCAAYLLTSIYNKFFTNKNVRTSI